MALQILTRQKRPKAGNPRPHALRFYQAAAAAADDAASETGFRVP